MTREKAVQTERNGQDQDACVLNVRLTELEGSGNDRLHEREEIMTTPRFWA